MTKESLYIFPLENITCTNGLNFSACAPIKPATCLQQSHQNMDAPGMCIPGCVCPPGLVQYKGSCIESTECPCYHSNREYEEGRNITKGCNTWYVNSFVGFIIIVFMFDVCVCACVRACVRACARVRSLARSLARARARAHIPI